MAAVPMQITRPTPISWSFGLRSHEPLRRRSSNAIMFGEWAVGTRSGDMGTYTDDQMGLELYQKVERVHLSSCANPWETW
jgi:hypothetical protein